jgi:hypothetical protein
MGSQWLRYASKILHAFFVTIEPACQSVAVTTISAILLLIALRHTYLGRFGIVLMLKRSHMFSGLFRRQVLSPIVSCQVFLPSDYSWLYRCRTYSGFA